MTTSDKTPDSVLRGASDQLVSARIGLAFMRDVDAERRVAGLRNVIVFGRAFTNAVQNLRSLVPDFENWYGPWQQRLKSDPIAQAFYRMRSEILKEGVTKTTAVVNINFMQLEEIKKYGPPGWTAFFVGDPQGRSGWVVQNEDGSEDHIYIELPPEVGDVNVEVYIPELPEELSSEPASSLAERYVALLEEMATDARKRFSKRAVKGSDA